MDQARPGAEGHGGQSPSRTDAGRAGQAAGDLSLEREDDDLGAADLIAPRATTGTAGSAPRPFLVGWHPTPGDARVASVRIRYLNPLRALRARGYPIEQFDPGRRARYSAVIFSKRYDDEAYAEADRLRAGGTRIVLDLCDNHFYNPDDLPLLRTAAAQLRRMARAADDLVASTDAMADVLRAEVEPARPVTVIGDAAETSIEGVRGGPWAGWLARRRLRALLYHLERKPARTPLVWFGAHGGPAGDHGMGDLESIRPMIAELDREHPVSLTVISNSAEKYTRLLRPWPVPTHYLPWDPSTFFDALRAHAVAVLPIRENPFTRCKTNNRLVTALMAGLGVVATGIPSYRPFAECCVLDDWSAGLRRYILDPGARRRAVAAGRALVERDWMLPSIADRWQQFFDGLRDSSGGSRATERQR